MFAAFRTAFKSDTNLVLLWCYLLFPLHMHPHLHI